MITESEIEDLHFPHIWDRCGWAILPHFFFFFKCTHDAWSWAAILAPCGEASGQKLTPTTYFQTHFLFEPPLGFLLLETKTWTLPF